MIITINLQELEAESSANSISKEEIIGDLSRALWQIGIFWDKTTGVDVLKGSPAQYGTANRRSMTYKLRKIAGFSYP